MRLTRQCFQLSRDFVHSFSREEVNATFADMEEMGIAHLPYPDLDIVTPANAIFSLKGYKNTAKIDDPEVIGTYNAMMVKLRYTNGVGEDWFARIEGGRWIPISEAFDEFLRRRPDEYPEGFDSGNRAYAFSIFHSLLVVALATRNIIKEVREHKAAQLGIGKGEYAATTTLKIGTIVETQYEGERGTHASPRPHLRRGHIRRQHHGPLNELVKKVWIAPCMVNVDQEFVDRRTAYNVSL